MKPILRGERLPADWSLHEYKGPERILRPGDTIVITADRAIHEDDALAYRDALGDAVSAAEGGTAVSVYVDDVRHRYGRMVMCHMWADSLDELLAMADRIGVARKWLQRPPKASWVHFDISLGKKAVAISAGAVLTDKYGPVEHVARLNGDAAKLEQIAKCRALPGGAP